MQAKYKKLIHSTVAIFLVSLFVFSISPESANSDEIGTVNLNNSFVSNF